MTKRKPRGITGLRKACEEIVAAHADIAKARHEALGRIRAVVAEWAEDGESSEAMRDVGKILEETP